MNIFKRLFKKEIKEDINLQEANCLLEEIESLEEDVETNIKDLIPQPEIIESYSWIIVRY